jgi:hypothetical protein
MFFSKMEGILKDYSDKNLGVLEFYYGIRLKLFRSNKDVHTSVYGAHAGAKATQIDEFTGILISDDFFASGPGSAGNFEEGFLFTRYTHVLVGDQLHVISRDNKTRRFVVVSREALGTQDTVFTKWKISNLAG